MTLVEVSIVVVLVGVLAAVAVVMFVRHKRRARMAEATNIVSTIKSEQEAYRGERGTYATVSQTIESYYPAPSPGKFTTAWGAPCPTGQCVDERAWLKLNVHPPEPVMYGYATISGVGAEITEPSSSSGSSGLPSFWGGSTSSGGVASPDDSAPPAEATPCTTIAPTEPYFAIKAKGDTDGDGISSTVLSLSCAGSLIITNEGE